MRGALLKHEEDAAIVGQDVALLGEMDLLQQQSVERDVKKRETLLHKIQQLTIDRVMYAPVMDLRALMGVGPKVTDHTITQVWMSPFPSWEDMKIKE